MDALAHHLMRHIVASNMTEFSRGKSGTLKGRKKIVGEGIGSFVLDREAVSSFDVARSLVYLPEELKGDWLYDVDIMKYALYSNNPYILGRGVKVMTLAEAVQRINRKRHLEADVSFSCTEPEGKWNVRVGSDLYHLNIEQVGDYVRQRFVPQIKIKYFLSPMKPID